MRCAWHIMRGNIKEMMAYLPCFVEHKSGASSLLSSQSFSPSQTKFAWIHLPLTHWKVLSPHFCFLLIEYSAKRDEKRKITWVKCGRINTINIIIIIIRHEKKTKKVQEKRPTFGTQLFYVLHNVIIKGKESFWKATK